MYPQASTGILVLPCLLVIGTPCRLHFELEPALLFETHPLKGLQLFENSNNSAGKPHKVLHKGQARSYVWNVIMKMKLVSTISYPILSRVNANKVWSPKWTSAYRFRRFCSLLHSVGF